MLEFSYERNHFMHKFFENFSVRVSFWVLAALLFFLTFSPIFPYIIAMLAAFTVGIPLFLYPRKKGEGMAGRRVLRASLGGVPRREHAPIRPVRGDAFCVPRRGGIPGNQDAEGRR
mgnify:CR=1 FL=1